MVVAVVNTVVVVVTANAPVTKIEIEEITG
jgi:hypothetical protein